MSEEPLELSPAPDQPGKRPSPEKSPAAGKLRTALIISIPVLIIAIGIWGLFCTKPKPEPVERPKPQPSKQWERDSFYSAAKTMGAIDKLAGTYQPQERLAGIHLPSYAPVEELKKAFLDGYDAGYKE